MNIGDKIRHISSGTTGVITKLGHHTLYWKVTSIGPEPVPGVKLNSIQKTNPLLVGKTYELIKENKMKLTSKQKQLVKEYARKLVENLDAKTINENNTYTMISALREIVDDLLLETELLIDNKYGQLEHKEFKDAWYKSSNEFEKKFRNIIKNLMKSGK